MADEQVDAQLVARAQAGDRAAFASLVERYQQPLGGYLWRLTGDWELALDLTQDTFVRAYRSISTTRPGLVIRPWLYRIATNLAYDHLRRQRRYTRITRSLAGRESPGESERIEERELVERALARLRPRERSVLLLCGLEGLTYTETAAALATTPEAVRKQFGRAKARFRAAYAEEASGPWLRRS